jgi:GT2 family glycosyltransferase
MDLSILIVNWNTRDFLAQCLASVYAHPPSGSFEVIVVDNASADGSAAMVRQCFCETTLIENGQNPGFAAANNQSIALSRGRYLLLLNPDTIVFPGALSALITFMDQNPAVGAAGSLLLNPDGSLQPSCHPEPTLMRELWRLFHLDRLKPYALYPMETWPADQPRAVDTIQGAALIIRRSVVDAVGLLDDRYFMFSEEVDWCVRIRRAGWPIYWVPQSRVVHFGGQSTGQVASAMFVQLYRGKLQYFRKHYGAIHGLLYKGELLLASAARLLVIPFVWLLQPARRPDHVRLVQHYGRLILSLPGM